MPLRTNQNEVVIGAIAGVSLVLHLLFAGNFIPSSEIWLIGTIFYYFHSLLNLAVRLALLSVVVMIGSEQFRPGILPRLIGINRNIFPQIIIKLMAFAFAVSLVRMILPGPVTNYSLFYKISVALNFAGSVFMVLRFGATISFQSKPAFRRHAPTSTPTKEEEDATPPDDDNRSRR